MNIFGTEYNMRFTVHAQREIADLCPGKDIDNLGDLLSVADYTERLDNIYAICEILMRGYAAFAKFVLKDDKEYPVLPEEAYELLDPQEITDLVQELTAVIRGDRKATVEAEAPKK